MKAKEMNTPCSGPHFLKHGKDSRRAWKKHYREDEQPSQHLYPLWEHGCFVQQEAAQAIYPKAGCPGALFHSP